MELSTGGVLFLLFAAHALCDYPLQGDFLARAKNHRAPLPGVPPYIGLLAHCWIHAGAVFLITGSVLLGFLELWAHMLIDRAKCEERIDFETDQALHLACKAVWALLWALGLGVVWGSP